MKLLLIVACLFLVSDPPPDPPVTPPPTTASWHCEGHGVVEMMDIPHQLIVYGEVRCESEIRFTVDPLTAACGPDVMVEECTARAWFGILVAYYDEEGYFEKFDAYEYDQVVAASCGEESLKVEAHEPCSGKVAGTGSVRCAPCGRL